ncbi:MAG: cell wall-binding protein [Lacrimispora sp.]|uniref:cell wall-binding protein n=1 Tax=Lacrimispora sp. TaxID=2719234 RepID=UPI0039E533B2
MRKQTKLVAVLSTAALLALGASMSSFAATGWAEENGTWVYYDKNGDLASEKWEKSGDNWFYLNDDGEMSTDALIEYNDNFYYVDENGAMVTNQWVSIENEDYDGDDDEAANHWYYFQANGKAIKGSDNNTVNLKTINGKKYVFDNDGKMLYGWVDTNGERVTGDDAWSASSGGEFYFGDENDGAMTVGWIQLSITDSNASDTDADTAFDDEDQDRWFYFKTNGRKMKNETGKTINGKKYAFDTDGRMTAEWSQNASYVTPGTTTATPSTLVTGARSQQWRYYGTPEDGARVNKGWFKVVPARGLNATRYNNDEDRWYYSDNDGRLVANQLKTINGKKYAFDDKGGMVSGLKFISVLKADKNQIVTIHDGDYYDTEGEFDAFANATAGSWKAGETTPNFDWSSSIDDYVTYAYYFGGGEDGSMKTGKQTVDIDGDSFTFLFNKSGGTKGAGKIGEDSDKYYLNGKLVKADKDDKYSVVEVTKTGTTITTIKLLTTDQFVTSLGATLSADSTTTVNGEAVTQKKDNAYYTFPANTSSVTYHLVNTTGKVETGDRTKAKDGDSICYQVKNGKIIAVFEEK